MQLLIIILIVFLIVWSQKKGSRKGTERKRTPAKPNIPVRPSVVKKQASAVPNKVRKPQRTAEEAVMEMRTRESVKACSYEAAYSKGRPDRVGGRGDYEPVTPQGKVRIRCAYCGAQNFVPAGTHDHYHCYFAGKNYKMKRKFYE